MNPIVCLLVGRSVGWLVSLSPFPKEAGYLPFHAHIGELAVLSLVEYFAFMTILPANADALIYNFFILLSLTEDIGCSLNIVFFRRF